MRNKKGPGGGHVNINRSEGFPNGIFHPCALWARGLARWESCRHAVAVAAAVGVSWKFRFKISFLNSVVKSQAPDRPIRSVSSSEYRRIPRGPKLMTFFGQKSIFLSKIGKIDQIQSNSIKIPHFYPLWGAYLYKFGQFVLSLYQCSLR